MHSQSLLGVFGMLTITLGLAILASSTGVPGSSLGLVSNKDDELLIGGILVTLVGVLTYGMSVYTRRFPVPEEVSF